MPTVTMLIGVPGSGKSTWRTEALATSVPTPVVISSDDAIEFFAKMNGITYTQAFRLIDMKVIDREIRVDFEDALASGRDIIVDRTNMTRKSRASFLNRVPANYRKVAVVFDIDEVRLKVRLDKRAAETGKSIPTHIVNQMRASFQMPTNEEFHEVRIVTASDPVPA